MAKGSIRAFFITSNGTALHVCVRDKETVNCRKQHTRLHKGCLRLPDHSECLGLTLITTTQLQTPVYTHDVAIIMKLTPHTRQNISGTFPTGSGESLAAFFQSSWGNPAVDRGLKLPWRSQLVQPPLLSKNAYAAALHVVARSVWVEATFLT